MQGGYLSLEAQMADDLTRFFQELDQRDGDPVLTKTSGRVRFDLVDGSRTDRWTVTIDKGHVSVAHRGGAADCTVRADRAWFTRLSRGEENAIAAVLRGAVELTGDVELLFAIERLFPGSPGTHPTQSGRRASR
jgi:putative sterol carrier protein